ncbi:unnamed protein product [Alternaria alternata]
MPLVLISGFPSAGKTTRAVQLKEYFESKIASSPPDARTSRLKVHLINDQTLGVSRSVYHTAKAEKDARAEEYSAVKRVLSRDDIVIADGLNYIKGFRYQLYCEAKALQTPKLRCQYTMLGRPPNDVARTTRSSLADKDCDGGYDDDDFENLIFRYEEPNGMTRWDSPLFIVVEEDEKPPCDQIWDAMVGSDGKMKTVKPNLATVLKPATEQNYLYELDKTTSDILAQIMVYQKDHPGEGRIRRQFITMNRQHSLSKARLKEVFVDYLNAEFLR